MAAPERMPIDKEAVAATGGQASPAGLRNLHLITSGDTFKTLYWDPETAGMRPNLVFVDQTGAVVFESNEVGLKGPPSTRIASRCRLGRLGHLQLRTRLAVPARPARSGLPIPERRARWRPLPQYPAASRCL